MDSTPIEILIKKDLELFLYHKSLETLTTEDAVEIGAYVGANFLRIIFTKNKELKPEELNGVFGIISNVYNDLFGEQFTQNDYKKLSNRALELLKDTRFEQNSKVFFGKILENKK
ncbi:MAG TPA: hypothetical protein VKY33_05250 [Flavobacterium sp.]|nr:hypothetical protein [Flavobacterium sp.]